MVSRSPIGGPDDADPIDGDRVGGVILAAGRSTRMGRPKTGLMLGGRTLLQHVIDNALASRLAEVVVVLRADDEAGRASVDARPGARLRAVLLATPADQSDSLRAGITALGPRIDAAAVLLADQPGIDAASIDRVIDAATRSPHAAVRPVHIHAGHRTPGHPVVLKRGLFAEVRELTGDQGARALLQRDAVGLEEIELHTAAPLDVDTPEDWKRLVAEWATRSH
jgi:molybdenum cofactor cytidylyltransferase